MAANNKITSVNLGVSKDELNDIYELINDNGYAKNGIIKRAGKVDVYISIF